MGEKGEANLGSMERATMRLEVWDSAGGTYKHPRDITALKVGLHNHPDGKTYLSVQIDDDQLMLKQTLVIITSNPEVEFGVREEQ